MSITTLSGTRWKFNNYITNILIYPGYGWFSQNITITINFTIENDSVQYVKLYMYKYVGGGTSDEALYIYNSNNQYKDLRSALYNKVVTFTSEPVISGNSGKSVSDFITWLKNNATVYTDPTILFDGSPIERVYLDSSLVTQIYFGNVLIYEDVPEYAILDVNHGVIKASDGFLMTTEYNLTEGSLYIENANYIQNGTELLIE